MKMIRSDLTKYFHEWEKGTLDTIEQWVDRDSTGKCFYGRNTPRSQAGVCDAQKVETWHITGYSSTAPILDMALRHGRTEILRWHARNAELALEEIPWWFETWGKPPGEDARLFGICGTTKSDIIQAGNHGDTDIKRHFNARGTLRALIHPAVRQYGNWSDDQARNLAVELSAWIWSRRSSVYENPREYLRYGNDLDTLCGVINVFEATDRDTEATMAYETLKAFVNAIFNVSHRVHECGADGDSWYDYNYGEMVERKGNFYEPFSYGWYPYGMQAWYRGHLLGALIHAAEHAVARNDAIFLKAIIVVIDTLTRWFDPTRRTGAPVAPANEEESILFHNSVLQGGFVDPTRNRLLFRQNDTTLDDWASVTSSSADFRRYAWHDTGVGGWKSDGGYWKKFYVDPSGVVHVRKHNSGGANLYLPGLPGLETANGYECVDGLFARALIFQDRDLMDFARIVLFHHIGYCHLSDSVVTLGRRLKNGIVEGANLVGKPGRSFHWAMECGSELRAQDVGVVDGGSDGLSAFHSIFPK